MMRFSWHVRDEVFGSLIVEVDGPDQPAIDFDENDVATTQHVLDSSFSSISLNRIFRIEAKLQVTQVAI